METGTQPTVTPSHHASLDSLPVELLADIFEWVVFSSWASSALSPSGRTTSLDEFELVSDTRRSRALGVDFSLPHRTHSRSPPPRSTSSFYHSNNSSTTSLSPRIRSRSRSPAPSLDVKSFQAGNPSRDGWNSAAHLRNRLYAAIILSHISKRLRNVALECTPSIWSSIGVSCHDPWREPAKTLFWTELGLSRSKECPIDVNIELCIDKLQDSGEDTTSRCNLTGPAMVQLLDKIMAHQSRFRSYHLWLNATGWIKRYGGFEGMDHATRGTLSQLMMHPVLSSSGTGSCNMAQLQYLNVSIIPAHIGTPFDPYPRTEISTALKSLSVDGTSPPIVDNARLRHLSLRRMQGQSCPSQEEVFNFLRSSSHMLEEIDFNDWTTLVEEDGDMEEEVSSFDPPNESLILLRNLHRLDLSRIPLDVTHLVLSQFTFPQLDFLSISAPNPPSSSSSPVWDPSSWGCLPSTLHSVKAFEWSLFPTSSISNIQEDESDARFNSLLRIVFEEVLKRLYNVKEMVVKGRPSLLLLNDINQRLGPSSGSDTIVSRIRSPETAFLPHLKEIEFENVKHSLESIVCFVKERNDRTQGRRGSSCSLNKISISAPEIQLPLSAGRPALQAMDEVFVWLKKNVPTVDLRDLEDWKPFRFTFLGWKDAESYRMLGGRDREYDEEMEE